MPISTIVSQAFVPPWAMGIKVEFHSILGFRLTPQFLWGPFKYDVSKKVGRWGQKMAIFADLQYYLR